MGKQDLLPSRKEKAPSVNNEQAKMRLFATVLRDSNDAVIISDFEGRISAWNRGAELMYGYTEEDALKMTMWQITPPDKIAEKKAFITRLIAGEAVSSFETQRKTKDGRRILDVWLTLTKVMDDAGKPIGIASTERDITGRKQKEAEANRMVTVVQDSNDAITIQDFEGKILAWNHGAELMYGYSEQEALQKNIWLLTPPNRVKEQKDFTNRLIAGEKITSLETQRVTKDGRILDIWMTVTKLVTDAGKPIGIASTERDITERKWTEEALQASEEKFKNEFNNSAIGKSFTSLDGSVDVNPAFCEMLGYTKEELAHQKWQDFTHPDDNELTQKLLNELLSGEKSNIRCRKRYIKKDGSIVWADVNTVLQKDKEGKPLYYITEVVDITERKRAEEALLKSEGRLNFALQIIHTGAWELDLRDHTAHRTLLHDQIFGYKTLLPSWTYEMFLEHVVPEDRPEVDRSFGEAAASQTNWDFECRIRRIDGERRWIRAAGVHERNSEGSPVRMSGVVQDITDSKRVEEALKKNEERFRIVAESITDVIYEWDLKDSIYWFGNVDNLLGYPAGAFPRTLDGWVSALHPEDKERVWASVEKQLQGALPYDVEYRIKGKDDVLYWWSARGTVITDERGEKMKWLGAITDITERKRAEETLRMNEARFRTLVENIPQKIFMKDRDFRFVSINDNFARDLGMRPEDFVGKVDSDFFPKELAGKYRADDIRIMETGKTEELEEKYIQEGEETWVNTIKTPVKNANGDIVGVLGVFWDITERKRLEDRLHQYTMQLEQKSRDLEQIIYVTSHDLRTPLVNVQGFAKELSKSIMDLMEAINAGDISAEAMRRMAPILKRDIPESLEYIQSSIARMDMQLSSLLKLSRLGRAAIIMEKIDMNKAVADLVKSLEYVEKEKGARIKVDELPPCKADLAQTSQIFLNLIGNALKFLDSHRPGVIRISGNKQESWSVYCVEDNGIGIAREYQEKIFEIFYRVEHAKSSGEGLGLTIVRQSAEKQNGAVWVESEPGKGSKFFVKLPGI